MRKTNLRQVPFHLQTEIYGPGTTALQTVFEYYGEELDPIKIKKMVGTKKGKGIWPIQAAIGAANLGFPTEFYSKNLTISQEAVKELFFKEDIDKYSLQTDKLLKEAKEAGVATYEKTFSLDELTGFVDLDLIPIVTLDWNIVQGRHNKDYLGHLVPVVNYDAKNIIVQDSRSRTGAYFNINRSTFDAARKVLGADEDLIVIYRK